MAKKSFDMDNPAKAFMNIPQEAPKATQEESNGFTAVKTEKETKSKRVNLLIYPSLYNTIAAQAAAQNLSFNEYVNQALEYIAGGKR